MGGFFGIWRRLPECCQRLPSIQAGVCLVVWATLTAPLASAERQASSVGQGSSLPATKATRLAVTADVVLESGGTLHGVVQSATKAPAADSRVTLICDNKVIAEAKCDRLGRFAVSNLRGGKYFVAVAGENGIEWNSYRVWTPKAAPPKAGSVANVTLGNGLVRGQGPLPSVKFPEAALMAGVVVGAIAAPVIYHNSQKSNRIPASP